jgi:uncharacterized protein with ParB-like and HNH nuclease domain
MISRRIGSQGQPARLDSYWTEWKASGQLNSEKTMRESETLRTQYKVADFVTWQREGALKLNPNFQRRPVWKKGAKSYLIDTIVKGLPVPIIFLRDLKSDLKTYKAKREVVDGQQRIRTILSFVDPPLVKSFTDFDARRDEFVINSAHNAKLGGKSFADLDIEDKRKILDYQFSVHTFPATTDDREILQIFARMNATGVKLNAQELRNAEFYGQFKTLAYSLAEEQLTRWQKWEIFNPSQIARMNEVELVSEFMLLITNGVMEKSNATISKFYKRYDDKFTGSKEVAKRIRKVFDTIDTTFTEREIKEYFSNRTIFYALFAAIYDIHFGIPKLSNQGIKLKIGKKAAQVAPKSVAKIKAAARAILSRHVPRRVFKATRGATTHASERRVMISYLTTGKDH